MSEIVKEAFPRLIVRGADRAIEFYQDTLGANVAERHAETDGIVVFARLNLAQASFAVSEEKPDWGWLSPESLDGSPVLIQLDLADCDAVAERMVARQAVIVIPVKDRPYGKREGRIRDPFGHLWVLSEDLAV